MNKTKSQLIAELERLRVQCELLEKRPSATRAQRLWKESELRYRQLVDHLTDYVYTVQIRDGKVEKTIHGPGCVAITGYAPEDYTANPGLWIDMVVKQDRPAVTRLSKRALKGRPIHPLEHRIITRQGRLRWVRNTIVFRYDEKGGVQAYDGLINDITERKQAEESLLTAEGRYRSLINDVLESVRVAVVILDPDFKVVWVNRWYERYFGLKRMRVVGMKAQHLIETQFGPMFDESDTVIQKLNAGYEQNRMAVNFQCRLSEGPHRKERWLAHHSKPIVTGLYAGGRIEQYSDITAYKSIIEEITDSEQRHRRLVKHLTDYIYTVKVDEGKPIETFHGPGCLAVTGYTQAEFTGDPDLWIQMVHEEDREAVSLQAAKALSGEKAITLEHRIRHKDGSARWVRSTVAFRRNETGTLISYDGLVTDITEQKKARQLADLKQQQLVQADKMATLGILVSGVAHEINNPNNYISLNARNIQKVWRDARDILRRCRKETEAFTLAGIPFEKADEKVDRLIQGIQEGAGRIQKIIESLKNFARLDSGELNEIVDINQVIEASITIVHNLIKKSTHHFQVNLTENLPPVTGNFQKLEQVIINLLTNACQALPDTDRKLIIASGPDASGQNIVIRVIDTGRGISEVDLRHIFDPFFTTKRDTGGTGLGLSIAYGIVHDHKGELTIDSALKKGTNVTIRLPVAGMNRRTTHP